MKYLLFTIIPILGISCSSPNEPATSEPETVNPVATEVQEIDIEDVENATVAISTIDGLMKLEDLRYMSPQFLRYSRNMYFAQAGMEFNDPDLALFFSHHGTYPKLMEGEKLILDGMEQEAVQLISNLEEEIASERNRECAIIYKRLFNELPLFYIDQCYDADPGFILMDKEYAWTLTCSSIPVEYLIAHSKSYVQIQDEGALSVNQIEVTNIDSGCANGSAHEIMVHLQGTSDDYEDIILGFNASGEFSILFNENVTIRSIETIDKSTLEIHTKERCDLIGTYFCDRTFQYNTQSKEVILEPHSYDRVSVNVEVLENLTLYSTKSAAENHDLERSSGILSPGTSISITRFLADEKPVYFVESDVVSGWIYNYTDLQKTSTSFAD